MISPEMKRDLPLFRAKTMPQFCAFLSKSNSMTAKKSGKTRAKMHQK